MSEAQALFTVLRQSADPDPAAAIERHVSEAHDRELWDVNGVLLDGAFDAGSLVAALQEPAGASSPPAA